MSVGSKAAG